MKQLSCPFLTDYCDITSDKNLFPLADAVVYHIRDDINVRQANRYRQLNQRFIFALWESPMYTPDLRSFKNFFNWTMTYRFKSDIITSYYAGNAYVHTSSSFYKLMLRENVTKNLNLKIRKITHRPSDEILQKKKMGIAAALISNCGGSSGRISFINGLRKYIDVKIYGRCGEGCPGNRDCREYVAENYYYILTFENSLCSDYASKIKEKIFILYIIFNLS